MFPDKVKWVVKIEQKWNLVPSTIRQERVLKKCIRYDKNVQGTSGINFIIHKINKLIIINSPGGPPTLIEC